MHGSSHWHSEISHGHTSEKHKLGGVALINIAGFSIELLGGILFGSVALLSDAVHMLFDASAYITAFVASYVAESHEGSEYWTYGFHRLEVLAALLNGMFLIPVAGWIVWEAYQRFLNPVGINILMTLLIGAGGLVLNVVSVVYLHGKREMSLNERGAFYHLLGDAAGSLAVIVGVVVISYTGIIVVDPIVAVLIALLVIWSALKILAEGTGIILEKSPISASKIEEEVRTIDGITEVSNINAWQVCSKFRVCTLHMKVSVKTLEEAAEIRHKVEDRLKRKFNIQHLTLQVEEVGS